MAAAQCAECVLALLHRTWGRPVSARGVERGSSASGEAEGDGQTHPRKEEAPEEIEGLEWTEVPGKAALYPVPLLSPR